MMANQNAFKVELLAAVGSAVFKTSISANEIQEINNAVTLCIKVLWSIRRTAGLSYRKKGVKDSIDRLIDAFSSTLQTISSDAYSARAINRVSVELKEILSIGKYGDTRSIIVDRVCNIIQDFLFVVVQGLERSERSLTSVVAELRLCQQRIKSAMLTLHGFIIIDAVTRK